VGDDASGGLFSRLQWSGAKVQVQTELTKDKGLKLRTIVMVDGEILGSATLPWRNLGCGHALEHRRIRNYHKRLLRGLERLRDEKMADPQSLRGLIEKLVGAAMRHTSSLAAEVLSSIPGAKWSAVIAQDESLADVAPEGDKEAERWSQFALKLRELAEELARLTGCSEPGAIEVDSKDALLMMSSIGPATLIAQVDKSQSAVAQASLRRLVLESSS